MTLAEEYLGRTKALLLERLLQAAEAHASGCNPGSCYRGGGVICALHYMYGNGQLLCSMVEPSPELEAAYALGGVRGLYWAIPPERRKY